MFNFIQKLKIKQTPIQGQIIIDNKDTADLPISSELSSDYIKIFIKEDIPRDIYIKKIKTSPIADFLKQINPNILWNNDNQTVNNGTFFIIYNNNKTYNFLINDTLIEVSELSDYSNQKEERILKLYPQTKEFTYTLETTDKIENSKDLRVYSKNTSEFIGTRLTQDEAKEELNTLFQNMELLNEVKEDLPLNTLKVEVLDYINKEKTEKKM